MSISSDKPGEKTAVPDAGGRPGSARIRLSAWSVAAYVMVGLTALAAALSWASFFSTRGGLHGRDPLQSINYFVSMFAGIFLFLAAPILILVGTVCAWLGLRRRPVYRGLAITALVLNALCLVVLLLFTFFCFCWPATPGA
jgi:hypothetical protein